MIATITIKKIFLNSNALKKKKTEKNIKFPHLPSELYFGIFFHGSETAFHWTVSTSKHEFILYSSD